MEIDLSIMLKSYLLKFAVKIFVVYTFLGALFLIIVISRGLLPEIIVDREKYLDITKSKLKHFVHILQYFDHNARCTLVDLVPDELGKDLLSLMDQELTSPSSLSDDNEDEGDVQDDEDKIVSYSIF